MSSPIITKTIMIMFVVLLSLNLVLAAKPQCSDGIDNDGDSKIDVLVELNYNNNEFVQYSKDPFIIRSLVNSKSTLFGYTKIDDSGDDQGALNHDPVTAEKVCNILGYRTVESYDCLTDYDWGRCGWYSCFNNKMGIWNPVKKDFDIYNNSCTVGNKWISTIKCTNKIAQCSDGYDNNENGKFDYCLRDGSNSATCDPGCATPLDNDERMHDPDCDSSDDNEFVPVCNNNLDCDDDKLYTEDKCINPGLQNSICTHTNITCINDNDCGTNGFFGIEFCSSNDLFKNFKTSTCMNPGTTQSFCNVTTKIQLIKDCGDTICEENDNERYCVGNKVYRPKVCYNKGCSNINNVNQCFASNSEESVLINTCTYGCLDGACLPQCTTDLECSNGQVCINNQCVITGCKTNSDCGSNGFVGGIYCKTGDVYQDFKTYTCNNPSTPNAVCSSSISPKLKVDCIGGQTCSNGECITPNIRCNNNSECNDNNPKTEDKCINPGQANSYCTNLNITCSLDSDCGSNGFLNQLFCKESNVFDKYISYTCINPGTGFSLCINSTQDKNKLNCTNGCLNGACLGDNQCITDNDCDDDYYSENFCSDDDVYRDKYDYSCILNTCKKDTIRQVVRTCRYGCDNGECITNDDDDGFNYDENYPEDTPIILSYSPEPIYSYVNHTTNESIKKIETKKSIIKFNIWDYLWLILLILIIILIIVIVILLLRV
ncbi:MAG: hypothetical protein WC867_07970 [Candidatus Pacearchaeota archaeon]|jgi:hypothetical protein